MSRKHVKTLLYRTGLRLACKVSEQINKGLPLGYGVMVSTTDFDSVSSGSTPLIPTYLINNV